MRAHLPAAKLILRDLESGPATLYELQSVVRLSISSTKEYLRELNQKKMIYICSYERLRNGMRPVYALGDKQNAKKPQPYTKTEQMRRYRSKLKAKS